MISSWLADAVSSFCVSGTTSPPDRALAGRPNCIGRGALASGAAGVVDRRETGGSPQVRIRPLAHAVVLAAALAGSAAAAPQPLPPPQGTQSASAFAASYGTAGVTNVSATSQRVSCYAPELAVEWKLGPADGYLDGGLSPCGGAAATGEDVGPYATQDVANPPMRVKDHSESDIRADPTNPNHLIGQVKWAVDGEGYNHLLGFYESFDDGATWSTQGHVPGYEGSVDNTDPVGAFDPWGNFYSALHPSCFCDSTTFIGDYFGLAFAGGYAYTTSVSTFNHTGENPFFHQQQVVARLGMP